MSNKFELSSLPDTITFARPLTHLPCSHEFGPDPLLHLRRMMCRCKICLSLTHLFLPPSSSCTPSFRTVTWGRQLCREPQSVFTVRCTSSHAAAQLPTLLGASSSLPASGNVFYFFVLVRPCTTSACPPDAALLEMVA